jgi:hypothetical protein
VRRFAYLVVFSVSVLAISTAAAQELEPGAYSVSPVGVNIVVVANSFSGGDINFDPTLPVEDAKAKINTTSFG